MTSRLRGANPARTALLLTLLLLLAGCFGGGTAGISDFQSDQADPGAAEVQPEEPAAGQARNVLRSSMPSLAGMLPGDEFDFTVSGSFVDPLFQASARVLYDSRSLEAVRVSRGRAVPGSALFIGRRVEKDALPVPAAEQARGMDSVIPAAFTGRPGDAPLAPGEHELLVVRFRLRGAPPAASALPRLQNEYDFLQLRDSAGRRLSFDFESRVGGRQ